METATKFTTTIPRKFRLAFQQRTNGRNKSGKHYLWQKFSGNTTKRLQRENAKIKAIKKLLGNFSREKISMIFLPRKNTSRMYTEFEIVRKKFAPDAHRTIQL